MLKHRLIPNIILNDGNVVQSKNFIHTNIIGNAITAVDFFNSWASDEIIILDVSRNKNKRKEFHRIINNISKRCFVPLTIGGWISNTDEISQFLKEGADKVSINSELIRNPNLLSNAVKKFGSQCIVASIDVKKNAKNEYEVFSERGQSATGLNPVEWAQKLEELGAGEIFLTSIDHEGTDKGYDIKLIKNVAENISIPVIAFGGVSRWQHFVDGINLGKADAVSAANIFHFTEHSVFNAKKFLVENKINVRIPQFFNLPTPRKPKYNELF